MKYKNQNDMVSIRKMKFSDKADIARFMNNKNIWDNLRNFIPFPYNENDAENFINLIENDDNQIVFAIEYDKNFCGVIGLILQKDIYEKSAEIGYWIGEPYWGKGIASEAVKLITEYGFKKNDILRIYACVFEFNIASMKVLEKNGYIKEGILKKAIFKNGENIDEHRYYKLYSKE